MIHVLPNYEKHLHEESTTCICNPLVNMEEDEIIVVHNELTREERESDSIIDEDENLLAEKPDQELIDKGFQRLGMKGIKTRDGEELKEGDVIETIQGTKFYCVNYFNILPKIVDQEGKEFMLEDYMSPNIWRIGNLWDNTELRLLFKKLN